MMMISLLLQQHIHSLLSSLAFCCWRGRQINDDYDLYLRSRDNPHGRSLHGRLNLSTHIYMFIFPTTIRNYACILHTQKQEVYFFIVPANSRLAIKLFMTRQSTKLLTILEKWEVISHKNELRIQLESQFTAKRCVASYVSVYLHQCVDMCVCVWRRIFHLIKYKERDSEKKGNELGM